MAAPCESKQMKYAGVIDWIAQGMEGLGVAVIVVGIAAASWQFLRRWQSDDEAYDHYRQAIGRSILLGLEILVAGDIIQTVAVDPSFTSVGVLAVIVVVRTFLSWSLEVELRGRWPWQVAERSPRVRP